MPPLKFSHIDILVHDLERACAYYAHLFAAQVSQTQLWSRDGLRVRYAIVRMGEGGERFMLVQPEAGPLRELLDRQGEGTIYRHCYSTPDIEAAYDILLARGVQPEDELGRPLAREQLHNPSGARILWLPCRFGHFSIELLQADELERFIEQAFASPPPGVAR
ncbi:VOC family protein [Kinneretia aquatilis]|uniref:VOC family protein n=1 Tax=Kinneretia aquatilis TaxID=2070761 RepID=UPI0014951888|nr:VOC family protein [Paucibacter aquatile]WIV97543.1 VOC family protein [Paucibacter aquatile]